MSFRTPTTTKTKPAPRRKTVKTRTFPQAGSSFRTTRSGEAR
jgi:hypothetical protein